MVISVRPKNRTRGVSFLKRRICCHPLLPPRTHSATAKNIKRQRGSLFFSHIRAFIVGAGPVFLLSRFTPSQQKASLLTSKKKKRKCAFLPAPRCSFEAHSVTTYHLNTRRFRLLGHIPHNLVDRPIQPATVAQRPPLGPSQRRSLTKKHPASIKNKEKKRRILRSST